MNTGLGFFPYEAMSYKAAQAWLDRRAEQGWELVHVYLGCIARFRQAARPSHFVDLDNRTDYSDTDPDYLQLCSDAGWELVQNVRGMLLFRAAPGKSPAPIQTDGGMEWERFWKKYRPRVWPILCCLAAIAFAVWARSLPSTENLAAAPASLSGLAFAAFLVFAAVYLALYLAYYVWYLARCRRSGQVEEPGRIAAFVDSLNRVYLLLLCVVSVLNLVVGQKGIGKTVDLSWYPLKDEYTATVENLREWPVVMAADLDLPDNAYSRHLDGFRSPLMDYLEYRELTDSENPDGPHYILTTERYDCISEGLAKWAVDQRRDETLDGKFLWGKLDWADLGAQGFDECYITVDRSYILFRQGRVVALVGCTGLDLTVPQNLEAVRERILGGTG